MLNGIDWRCQRHYRRSGWRNYCDAGPDRHVGTDLDNRSLVDMWRGMDAYMAHAERQIDKIRRQVPQGVTISLFGHFRKFECP